MLKNLQKKKWKLAWTLQHAALNDVYTKYIDVLLNPWLALHRPNKKVLLVWDNCPSHHVKTVTGSFQSSNIELGFLPPNMTDILQVMDLVVNATLKSGLRRRHCDILYQSFQTWQTETSKKLRKDKSYKIEQFLPPKVSLVDGLNAVIDVCESTFKEDSFKTSLRRGFVRGMLVKDKDAKDYNVYTGLIKHGSVSESMAPVTAIDVTDMKMTKVTFEEVLRSGVECKSEFQQLQEEEEKLKAEHEGTDESEDESTDDESEKD